MLYEIDLLEVAREIAEIASETREPETARRLIELVDQLLQEGSLPPSYH
jgi:rRNA pseudouridine-1189 N-methylase Emg1 (Nep1/Mra1 family)